MEHDQVNGPGRGWEKGRDRGREGGRGEADALPTEGGEEGGGAVELLPVGKNGEELGEEGEGGAIACCISSKEEGV